MGRTAIAGNERSRVLYARDAWNIMQAVMLLWSKDAVASIVSNPGLGQVSFNDALVKRGGATHTLGSFGETDDFSDAEEWLTEASAKVIFTDPVNNLSEELTGSVESTADETLASYNQLITLRNAANWLRDEFKRVQLQMKVKSARAEVPGKAGRFRVFLHYARAATKAEFFLQLGIDRMEAVCLTQKRRVRGPQLVQTRKNLDGIGYYETFTFNGTYAVRMPPGGRSLSEAEWLKRNAERNRKRNKTGRRRKDKRTLTIPRTKFGRPSQQLSQDLKLFDKKKSGPTFDTADLNTESLLEEFRNAAV